MGEAVLLLRCWAARACRCAGYVHEGGRVVAADRVGTLSFAWLSVSLEEPGVCRGVIDEICFARQQQPSTNNTLMWGYPSSSHTLSQQDHAAMIGTPQPSMAYSPYAHGIPSLLLFLSVRCPISL